MVRVIPLERDRSFSSRGRLLTAGSLACLDENEEDGGECVHSSASSFSESEARDSPASSAEDESPGINLIPTKASNDAVNDGGKPPVGRWKRAAQTVAKQRMYAKKFDVSGRFYDDQLEMKEELDTACFDEIKVPSYIVRHNGPFRIAWDEFMLVILMFLMVYIPLRLGVLEPLNFSDIGGWEGFEIAIDGLFTIDIILNFFTSYFDHSRGRAVTDLRMIAKRYICSYFLIDALATFPFYLFFQDDSSWRRTGKLARIPRLFRLLRTLRLLKLLKMTRLQQLLRKAVVKRGVVNMRIDPDTLHLVGIGFWVVLATHIIACFWLFIGKETTDLDCLDPPDFLSLEHCPWVYRQFYSDQSAQSLYVASIYWATQSLSTVGYGDIQARTLEEQVFAIFVMVGGVSWYAYIIGSISNTMAKIQRKRQAASSQLAAVEAFVQATNCPKSLAKRIRAHYLYSARGEKIAWEGVINDLPSALQNECICFLNKEQVDKCNFLRFKGVGFIADVVRKWQRMRVLEDDNVTTEGETAESMFIILSGTISLYIGERLVGTVAAGDTIGELACMKNARYQLTAQSTTACELRAISKRDLSVLAHDYPLELKSWIDLASSKMEEFYLLGSLDSPRLKRETAMFQRRGSSFRLRSASAIMGGMQRHSIGGAGGRSGDAENCNSHAMELAVASIKSQVDEISSTVQKLWNSRGEQDDEARK